MAIGHRSGMHELAHRKLRTSAHPVVRRPCLGGRGALHHDYYHHPELTGDHRIVTTCTDGARAITRYDDELKRWNTEVITSPKGDKPPAGWPIPGKPPWSGGTHEPIPAPR